MSTARDVDTEAADRENYETIYIGHRGIGAVYQVAGQWHSLEGGKVRPHASLSYALNHLLKKAKVLR